MRKKLKESRKNQTRRAETVGKKYPHEGGMLKCPAQGSECYNCGKFNHFAKYCRSKPRQENATGTRQADRKPARRSGLRKLSDDSESNEGVFTLSLYSIGNNRNKHPMFKVRVNDARLNLLADSGSSINLLDCKSFNRLKQRPTLEPTNAKIYPYKSATFYLTEITDGSVLSWRTSEALELIEVARPLIAPTSDDRVDQLVRQYDDLFHGLGKLKGRQVKIHIDETVRPVAQPHRRVAFHVRKELEEQLEKDEQQGVIELVDGPTPWVSPIVVAPKREPGKVRVCIDMKQANKAIERERHPTPTIKEIIKALNGATVFSKLDLSQGYNQVEQEIIKLTPESRYITTFSTHLGLRQYTCLNFGVSSAAEIFQNIICETLAGIPGAINLSDDILVFGKSQEEHDQALEATFKRLQESGLTLNRNKCVYNQAELAFFGYVFSADGMSPDPSKVQEIINLATPSTVSESSSRQEKVAEEFVDYLAKTSTPKAIDIHEIIAATKQDPTLQAVTKAMDKGDWFKFSKEPCIDTDLYKAMEKVRHELTLSTTHGIILKGTRIVMPTTLQQRVIDLAHVGHQGIVKTKKLLREKVWFPRMNNMVEKKTTSCGACQIATPRRTRKPLKMSPLPASPLFYEGPPDMKR
ncbi:uncharacterized protein K02A2.6-like [Acropora millepora]|uniref:uncharacterized protein K02A2.6-like n=1 Tax=Acropora millepora TaxID=45264 RepID=UPI001CF280B0|nr:uncharacterized protein K02A2.6-like [Acropora millepora]